MNLYIRFNDVFGFFLDGKNIALIPATESPVSIDNVNGGNPLGIQMLRIHIFSTITIVLMADHFLRLNMMVSLKF